jgi:hypothetical protein
VARRRYLRHDTRLAAVAVQHPPADRNSSDFDSCMPARVLGTEAGEGRCHHSGHNMVVVDIAARVVHFSRPNRCL